MIPDFIGYINHAVPTGEQIRMQDLPITFPLMQFTGLLDSKGKEIYEGDIVEITKDHLANSGVENVTHRAVVKFIEGQFLPRVKSIEIEIIGNSFENPELLSK